MTRSPVLVRSCFLASTLLASTLIGLPAHASTQEELEAKVQALSEQLDALKREMAQMKQSSASAPASTPTSVVASNANTAQTSAPTFSGYGELNYTRPRGDSSAAQADVGRFVIGIGYEFDERTRFAGELEIEHAVSSADDPGEVEVEQAYIERELTNSIYAKVGLFLIPSGLLNESHEPTRYYGVFRNFVETAIIPTTWREGGLALQGRTEFGLRWDIGATTGFDLSKWDSSSEGEGQESPLGSIHQELAVARASDISGFAALNYNGVPGLTLGASLFMGDAGQGQPSFDNARVSLWEGHARWSPGPFEFSGLYAHGHISDTRGINLTLIGNPILIPENFFGWYLESAYRVWESGTWALTPFVRYETFNTAADYADIGAGFTPPALSDRRVWTMGTNIAIANGVVLKADYLNFRNTSEGDRFDLGVGYQF